MRFFLRHLRFSLPALVVLTFLVGAWAGYTFHLHEEHRSNFAIREYDERYTYIRPLLVCQVNESEDRESNALEHKMSQVIAKAKEDGKLIEDSVYFRALTSGTWAGVNESVSFAPASLLKVPVMMAYFKMAEEDPSVLTRRYIYTREADDVNTLVEKPLLVPGRSYSVDELIAGMIIQSDNGAKDILAREADTEKLEYAYEVLGIADPYSSTQEDETYELTAKSYGLFFRVLYNSTYLEREMSNRALELLTEAEFDLALRAGTPSQIPVAHKFGSRISDDTDQVELSDCGIVYEPRAPYLLCVMTKGDNPFTLASVISDIAATAYQTVATGGL